jgi:hypothetical protein
LTNGKKQKRRNKPDPPEIECQHGKAKTIGEQSKSQSSRFTESVCHWPNESTLNTNKDNADASEDCGGSGKTKSVAITGQQREGRFESTEGNHSNKRDHDQSNNLCASRGRCVIGMCVMQHSVRGFNNARAIECRLRSDVLRISASSGELCLACSNNVSTCKRVTFDSTSSFRKPLERDQCIRGSNRRRNEEGNLGTTECGKRTDCRARHETNTESGTDEPHVPSTLSRR